jgi:hypothetical protein
VLDPAIWQFTLHRLETPDEVSRYVAAALDDAAAGRALAFVIVLRLEALMTRRLLPHP